MKLTAEQLAGFAKELAGLAAVFNPAAASSIELLITAATQLNTMVQSIKDNDPELWAKSVENFKKAREEFEASQPEV